MTFAQRMRQIWIDAQLSNGGLLRRAAICNAFQITVAVAASDLKAYLTAHPEKISYDKSRRGYRRTGSASAYPKNTHTMVIAAQQAVIDQST